MKTFLTIALALMSPAIGLSQVGSFSASVFSSSSPDSLFDVSKPQWKSLSGRYAKLFASLEKTNAALLDFPPDGEQCKKLINEAAKIYAEIPKSVAKAEQKAKDRADKVASEILDDVKTQLRIAKGHGDHNITRRQIAIRNQLRYVAEAMNAKSFAVPELEIEKEKAK